MAKIINLFGASGAGKSTLAAGLFYELKLRNKNVELVTEHCKDWAWQQRPINKFNQIEIVAEQIRREHILLDKVDIIITDSPVLLSPAYEYFRNGDSLTKTLVKGYLKKTQDHERINLLLTRPSIFTPEGRYEDQNMADEFDEFLKCFLKANDIHCLVNRNEGRDRLDNVLYDLEDMI